MALTNESYLIVVACLLARIVIHIPALFLFLLCCSSDNRRCLWSLNASASFTIDLVRACLAVVVRRTKHSHTKTREKRSLRVVVMLGSFIHSFCRPSAGNREQGREHHGPAASLG
ncbi:hypothetical protein OH77DRAFT_474856 [Trametes cingulata]|nr:hypothetical protein OH77DRAFT_474856 [Trametes cingulata]